VRLVNEKHLTAAGTECRLALGKSWSFLKAVAKMARYPVHPTPDLWPGQFVVMAGGNGHEQCELWTSSLGSFNP
jgi:hypothetical protein